MKPHLDHKIQGEWASKGKNQPAYEAKPRDGGMPAGEMSSGDRKLPEKTRGKVTKGRDKNMR